jgi:hypothetical protein
MSKSTSRDASSGCNAAASPVATWKVIREYRHVRRSITGATIAAASGSVAPIRSSPAVFVIQFRRTMTPELRQSIVDGGYWLREPGPNCQVVVAYMHPASAARCSLPSRPTRF